GRAALRRDRGPQRGRAGGAAGHRQRAGQGLALHEDGTRRGGDRRPRATTRTRRSLMLVSLAAWLQTLDPAFGFLRVVQFITFRAVMAAMTALLIGVIAGPWVIRRLTELKIGQPVRDY